MKPELAGPQQKPTLAIFYSATSGRCRRIDGFLAQVLQKRKNHETFKVLRVSCDEHPELRERFSVSAVPTLFVIEGKEVRGRLDAPRGCRDLERFLSPWLA